MIETLPPVHGIISLYAIPEEFAQDTALFDAWWLPKTERGADGLYRVVEEARISDEAKAQRLVMPPVENLLVNAGISVILTDLSLQSGLTVFYNITSVGNGAISGVARGNTSVAGDGFASGARKVPSSHSVVGFGSTIITNFASGDAVGTWTNCGIYGNGATTTTGSGTLYTNALLPFVKGSVAYSLNYVVLLSN